MDENVLQTIKKLLGIDASVEGFDVDVKFAIDTALMVLDQLGVPLKAKMLMSGEETFGDLTDYPELAAQLPSYIFLKVRLLFDPPSTSFVIDAIQKQIQEIEWRLNVQYEGKEVNQNGELSPALRNLRDEVGCEEK